MLIYLFCYALLLNGDLLGGKKQAYIPCSLLQLTYTAHAPKNHQSPSNQQGVGPVCRLCQVSCSSMFNLLQHRQGKQHKAKQESLKNVGMKQNQTFRCDVCRISCIDMTSLQQHRAGKKHAAQLRQRPLR